MVYNRNQDYEYCSLDFRCRPLILLLLSSIYKSYLFQIYLVLNLKNYFLVLPDKGFMQL